MRTPPLEEMTNLVMKQLNLYWPTPDSIAAYQPRTFQRIEKCFRHTNSKYFWDGDECIFSYTNSVQYAIYLYYLANTIYLECGKCELCDKIYYLNKILNGTDWFYEIALPDIFHCEHPVGSVMGRAAYSNRLCFYQGCTVGGSNGKYPILGENILMYSYASVLGDSIIGDNVVISTGALVLNEKVPSNSIVFGRSPDLVIVSKAKEYVESKSQRFWR